MEIVQTVIGINTIVAHMILSLCFCFMAATRSGIALNLSQRAALMKGKVLAALPLALSWSQTGKCSIGLRFETKPLLAALIKRAGNACFARATDN